jgi:hypothetical protein
MTAAEIPAPPGGWRLACQCGTPVALGAGSFAEASLRALEHLKRCPVHRLHATLPLAVSELVTTTLWSCPGHYQRFRDLFYKAQQDAHRQGAPSVRSGGCGGCG